MNAFSTKIKIYFSLIVSLILFVGLTSCENDLSVPESGSTTVEVKGDSIIIHGAINVQVMTQTVSRGGLGHTPNEDLCLTIFEFDYVKGHSDLSFLTNIYHAEITSTTAVANGEIVNFKVTLKSASSPKILHLTLSDSYLSSEVFGSEAFILPSLVVGNDDDGPGMEMSNGLKSTGARSIDPEQYPEAYWGKVIFEDGYSTIEADDEIKVHPDLVNKLKNIPMLRNFACLTVTDEVIEEKFKLTGFAVVNVPNAGAIVPWIRSSLSVPELLDSDNKMKAYKDIDYTGVLPANTSFDNSENALRNYTNNDDDEVFQTDPFYMYEHPYELEQRTYIIIKGEYKESQNDEAKTTYYKIDIGAPDENNNFEYFNIIRNIQYNIKIKSVSGVGSESLSDAIDALPSNNIKADTETASMLSMSDGTNLIMVNRLTHIIVDTEPVEFMYRYVTNINSKDKKENNSANDLKVVGLVPGKVIDYFDGPATVQTTSGNWVSYTIYPNEPTSEVQTQSFTVVDKYGLGRTINLLLRTPWQYAPLGPGTDRTITVGPGDDEDYSHFWIENPQPISDESGKPFTVYFNLPNGLPKEMFPLEFQIESKNQIMDNNNIDNMVVSSGKSLFDQNKIAISYIKEVTYNDYYQNRLHTVPCKFKTITPGSDSDMIKIYNRYFSPNPEITVVRSEGGIMM